MTLNAQRSDSKQKVWTWQHFFGQAKPSQPEGHIRPVSEVLTEYNLAKAAWEQRRKHDTRRTHR